MAKKLIDTDVKLGENTLLIEALESLGIDFPIDWGENSDGKWEKWNSGKLICWGSSSTTPNTNHLVAFPMRFIDNPHIQGSVNRAGGYDYLVAQMKQNGSYSFYIYSWATRGSTPSTINVDWEAKGRWK